MQKQKKRVSVECTDNQDAIRNHQPPMPMIVDIEDFIAWLKTDNINGSLLGKEIGKQIVERFNMQQIQAERKEDAPRRIWMNWRNVQIVPSHMMAKAYPTVHSYQSMQDAFMVMGMAQQMAEMIGAKKVGSLLMFVNGSPAIKDAFEGVLSRMAKEPAAEPSVTEVLLENMGKNEDDNVPF